MLFGQFGELGSSPPLRAGVQMPSAVTAVAAAEAVVNEGQPASYEEQRVFMQARAAQKKEVRALLYLWHMWGVLYVQPLCATTCVLLFHDSQCFIIIRSAEMQWSNRGAANPSSPRRPARRVPSLVRAAGREAAAGVAVGDGRVLQLATRAPRRVPRKRHRHAEAAAEGGAAAPTATGVVTPACSPPLQPPPCRGMKGPLLPRQRAPKTLGAGVGGGAARATTRRLGGHLLQRQQQARTVPRASPQGVRLPSRSRRHTRRAKAAPGVPGAAADATWAQPTAVLQTQRAARRRSSSKEVVGRLPAPHRLLPPPEGGPARVAAAVVEVAHVPTGRLLQPPQQRLCRRLRSLDHSVQAFSAGQPLA